MVAAVVAEHKLCSAFLGKIMFKAVADRERERERKRVNSKRTICDIGKKDVDGKYVLGFR